MGISTSTIHIEGDGPQGNFKPLLNASEAKYSYVAKGLLNQDCSNQELELCALLNDSLCFKSCFHYASPEHQWMMMFWRDISGVWEDRDALLQRFVPLTKSPPDLVAAEFSQLVGIISNGNMSTSQDQYQALAKSIRTICFTALMRVFYPDFIMSTKYNDMCANLQSFNHIKADDFEYFRKIGAGGFGIIFWCRKKSTGEQYAMKVQRKVDLLRHHKAKPSNIHAEVAALRVCDHPYLVKLTYAFQNEMLVMLTLPLGAAGDLRRLLLLHMRLDYQLARFYASEIVSVLCYLHKRSLIYRDLKPDNVIVMADGHIMLCDLGSVSGRCGLCAAVCSVCCSYRCCAWLSVCRQEGCVEGHCPAGTPAQGNQGNDADATHHRHLFRIGQPRFVGQQSPIKSRYFGNA